MIGRLLVSLLAALALTVPAFALGVLRKLPAQLDPAKAYIVVESGKLDNGLLFGSLVLARYDAARGDIAEATPRPKGHKGDWVIDNRVYLQKPLLKDKQRNLYLAELDPGLWVIEGANDTAFSLGSSTLRLEAGTVTDLGVATVYSDCPEGDKCETLTMGRLLKGGLMGGLFGSIKPPPMPKAVDFRARGTADLQLPALLAAAAHPVSWSGEVRFGNYLGGLINRMGGRKARPGAVPPQVAPTAAVQPAPAASPQPSVPAS